ncbi:hypothetical protein GCM10022226_01010 [Sphaerisporangium flaviroseum]|uniref:Uncharacterized protein n=1 Tax=Sphaerisporangium flaviroseum TaxID=509199 RepID=A0ABP7H724_9ACTN
MCQALEDTAAAVDGQPGCPRRVCVTPGAPAWECADPCTDAQGGGQLTVHVYRLYPSNQQFPQEDRTVRGLVNCVPPPTTAAEMVVTLLRCVPTLDERGCPLACAELEAAARVAYVDAVTVYNALMCCLPHTAGPRGRRFVMAPKRSSARRAGAPGWSSGSPWRCPGAPPARGTCRERTGHRPDRRTRAQAPGLGPGRGDRPPGARARRADQALSKVLPPVDTGTLRSRIFIEGPRRGESTTG